MLLFQRTNGTAHRAAALLLIVLSALSGRMSHAGEAKGQVDLADTFDSLRSQLRLKNNPWATVPWKVSVSEARELAAGSRKPIFLVVNTGNCLGFV